MQFIFHYPHYTTVVVISWRVIERVIESLPREILIETPIESPIEHSKLWSSRATSIGQLFQRAPMKFQENPRDLVAPLRSGFLRRQIDHQVVPSEVNLIRPFENHKILLTRFL